MGILAQYYQIRKENNDEFLVETRASNQRFQNVFKNRGAILKHLDIDKSWRFLIEVLAELSKNKFDYERVKLSICGNELSKSYEYDGLLNYSSFEDVKLINTFFSTFDHSDKNKFLESIKSTEYGKHYDDDYYDYIYFHYKNLKEFYLICEREESCVLVAIG